MSRSDITNKVVGCNCSGQVIHVQYPWAIRIFKIGTAGSSKTSVNIYQ